MTDREKIIANYINGYNSFDIDKMVADFDRDIEFENISNGETNMSLKGLPEFRKQAEEAKTYFSKREQTIQSFKHLDDETEVNIEYYAVLAFDFPNGMKKGDELKMKGRSVFKFKKDKIISLTDIS